MQPFQPSVLPFDERAMAKPSSLPVNLPDASTVALADPVVAPAGSLQPAESAALKLIQPIFGDQAYPLNVATVDPVVVLTCTLYAGPLPAPTLVELKLIQPILDDHAQPERGEAACAECQNAPRAIAKARTRAVGMFFFIYMYANWKRW